MEEVSIVDLSRLAIHSGKTVLSSTEEDVYLMLVTAEMMGRK